MVFPIIAFMGVGGILGMTVLFPLMASIISGVFRRNSGRPPPVRREIAEVTVIIPAHNEEALLSKTINSIGSAISHVRKTHDCRFEVIVAADGCTDRTVDIATKNLVKVIKFPIRQGKWVAISEIIKLHANGEWIILADCGIEWDQNLLAELLPHFSDENVIGVAPAYRNRNARLLESLMWKIEAISKHIESECGGPISVHGATVCYRREELLSALSALSIKQNWLNDDVVIPLTLRALYPLKQISYLLSSQVYDILKNPSGKTNSELKRRKRLAIGNIEWIQTLWVPLWRLNYVAAMLACRRIFRMLWAYWLLFLIISIGFYLGFTKLPVSIALILVTISALGIILMPSLKNLLHCAYASFMSPIYFVAMMLKNKELSRELSWS